MCLYMQLFHPINEVHVGTRFHLTDVTLIKMTLPLIPVSVGCVHGCGVFAPRAFLRSPVRPKVR